MCEYPELFTVCLSARFLCVWYQILQRREGIFKNSGQLLVCAIIYHRVKRGCTILVYTPSLLLAPAHVMLQGEGRSRNSSFWSKLIQEHCLPASMLPWLIPLRGHLCSNSGGREAQGQHCLFMAELQTCVGSQPWKTSVVTQIWLCCSPCHCHVLLLLSFLCMGFPNPWFTCPSIAFCTPAPLEVDSFISRVEVNFEVIKGVVDSVRDDIQALQIEMEWGFVCLECSRIIEREITPEMDHLIFFQAIYTLLGSPCSMWQITQTEGQEWKMDGLTP